MRISFCVCFILIVLLVDLADSTLSKPKKDGSKKKKTQVKDEVASSNLKTTVLERGLVTEKVTSLDIVDNHGKYSQKHKNQRRFDSGEVLAYVTPWNSHGYDVAKVFGKFTMLSPVWLQIKRKSRGIFNVEGTQDIDRGWLKELGRKKPPPKIVPRVLFDKWSESDYNSLFKSEDEIESMTTAIIDVLNENKMQGAVVEIWSQIGEKYPKETIHVITHMAEMFHEHNLLFILVVPAALNKDEKLMTTFRSEEFETLAPLVDYISLMTYDFSINSGHAGPNSPLPWVKACVEFLDRQAQHRNKILMGMNFYGHMFSPKGSAPIVGSQYLDFLKMHNPDIVWEKSASEHYSQFGTDQTGKGILFFPTLKFIEDRLKLAKSLGVGISIWEIGQGFDYFYDLL